MSLPRSFQLESDRCSTPLQRVNIGDGLGEVPTMTGEVLGVVLALAVYMIGRFREDMGAMLAGSFTVSKGIFDADLDDVGVIGCDVAFGNR